MAYCPADGKPCIDDLCYGGGCLRTGEPMLTPCPGCGALVGIDGSDPNDECACRAYDDDDWEPDDEEDD
jgi:hypothetical protein